MIPAQCMGCGKTVLSLWSSLVQLTPTTECQSCGKKVRKRGGRGELFAALMFFALIIYADRVSADGAWIWGGAAVFALYMEWWSWRSIPWDVDQPEPDTP